MSVVASDFQSVDDFLRDNKASLEKHEAAHQILLDFCFHLKNSKKNLSSNLYLKAFEDNEKFLFAAMAQSQRLILSGDIDVENSSRLSEWIENIASGFVAENCMPSGVIGVPKIVEKFVERWGNVSSSTFQKGRRLCIYQTSEVKNTSTAQGQCRLATMDDIELIIRWLGDAQKEECPEAQIPAVRETVESKIKSHEIYFWEDLQPVSLVSIAHTALNSVRLTLVYTSPEFRNQGYGSAITIEVTRMLLNAGSKICVVISDTSNLTARRLYEHVGYKFVCELHEYSFKN